MIIGNLTRDPEVKTIPSGHAVAKLGIATNRVWKDSQTGEQKEQVEYHNIVAWRRLAEICGQYLKKGSKVYIEGRLQTRNWDDQNGVKHYMTEIVADNMIMLDRPPSAGDGAGQAAPSISSEPTDTPSAPAEEGGGEEIQVENIPF